MCSRVPPPFAGGQLRELPALAGVFVAREGRLLGRLAQRLAGVGGGEDMFETWMKRESDLVQATALAYAEREVLEASMRAVQQASSPAMPLMPCMTGPPSDLRIASLLLGVEARGCCTREGCETRSPEGAS